MLEAADDILAYVVSKAISKTEYIERNPKKVIQKENKNYLLK